MAASAGMDEARNHASATHVSDGARPRVFTRAVMDPIFFWIRIHLPSALGRSGSGAESMLEPASVVVSIGGSGSRIRSGAGTKSIM